MAVDGLDRRRCRGGKREILKEGARWGAATRFSPSEEDNEWDGTRDRMAEPISRDQILRQERGQGKHVTTIHNIMQI